MCLTTAFRKTALDGRFPGAAVVCGRPCGFPLHCCGPLPSLLMQPSFWLATGHPVFHGALPHTHKEEGNVPSYAPITMILSLLAVMIRAGVTGLWDTAHRSGANVYGGGGFWGKLFSLIKNRKIDAGKLPLLLSLHVAMRRRDCWPCSGHLRPQGQV